MRSIVKKSENVTLRYSEIKDIDFIITAENQEENSPYVDQWSREKHIKALTNEDILHLIVEDSNNNTIGYLIMAGILNSSHNIEFKRFVICEKGKGFGREVFRLIKELSFTKLNAHRLWLDLRLKNERAKKLYLSEGFKEEGILREAVLYKGEYESVLIMSILENEYR